jgi:hypothetical protein
MLARPPSSRRAARRSRSPGAIDQAEHRRREREGIVRCVWTPIHKRVLTAMLERGLTDAESYDPKRVGREAGDLLLQWADRWLAEQR